MILPPYFAKLAARGQASIALIPQREPRDVKRPGPRGTKRTGRSATYRSQPWTPETGRHETLRPTPSPRRRAPEQTPVSTVLAHIIITSHTTLLLADLLDQTPETLRLVRATGVKTRAEFANEWMRHHDNDWPALTEELCPRCSGTALLDDNEECPDCEYGAILIESTPPDDVILDRFKARHGNRLVHAVTFQLDRTDHLRLLSPAAKPRGDDLGYTENPSNALDGNADPGEAVPLSYQANLSKLAHELHEQARRAQSGKANRNLARAAKRRAA